MPLIDEIETMSDFNDGELTGAQEFFCFFALASIT